MRKFYIHSGKGHHIVSTVIVLAENFKDAEIAISKELFENGLSEEALDIKEMKVGNGTQVIYSYGGEY